MIEDPALRRLLDEGRGESGWDDAVPDADLPGLIALAGAEVNRAPDDAAEVLDRLAAVAGRRGRLECEAEASYLGARARTHLGELEGALARIQRAEFCFAESGDRLGALRTRLGRMHVLDDLGRHDEAIAIGRATDGELAELDDDDDTVWLGGAVAGNLGAALGYTGDHHGALDACRRAAAAWERLGLEHERLVATANEGVELVALGRGPEAAELLAEAVDGLARLDDLVWAAKARAHLADALTAAGRYQEALREIAVAIDELRTAGAASEALRAALAEARILGLLGDSARSLARLDDLDGPLVDGGLRHDAAQASVLRAEVGLLDGHADLDAAEGAVAMMDEVGDGPGRVHALLVRSACSQAVGDEDGARRDASAAAEALVGVDWPVAAVTVAARMADVGVPTDLAEAARVADRLRVPHLVAAIGWRRGRAARAAGDVEVAREVLDDAVLVADAIRSSLGSLALRRAWLGSASRAHEELLALLAASDDPDDHERGLAISDASKTRTLREAAVGSRHRPDEGLGATLAAIHDALLRDGVTERHRRRLLADAVALERRLPPATTDVTIAGRVRIDGSVLAYHVLDDRVLGWSTLDGVVSGGAVDLGPVTAVAAHLRELRELRARLRLGAGFLERHGARLRRTVGSLAHELHELLVAPLLQGHPDGPVLVVPHGIVADVPFALLHAGDEPLLVRREVSSALSLAGLRRPPDDEPAGTVVIGVHDPDVPGLESEAHDVATVLDTPDLVVGDRATSGALLSASGRGLDVLHLACHGRFLADAPRLSGLRLADRWVTAAEISALDLTGTLVVLSACESGRRDVRPREAVGLPHAFVAAGARGVVASQWLVPDRAAEALMTGFHRARRDGQAPSAALRSSSLDLRGRDLDPVSWAAFTHIVGQHPRAGTWQDTTHHAHG